MTEENFIKEMLNLLDIEEIDMEMKLDDIEEWDSLSFVSFLAMVNVRIGRKLDTKVVVESKYVKDLFELLK